jgi:hypothetical protein
LTRAKSLALICPGSMRPQARFLTAEILCLAS